ncbi:MAG: glycoside hydrolase family 3 C-terminal domain-containing protein [Lachnospiraceae bacterium]|nr:glycoside hydrolase family 3 C-terminal domain-containing protein [Lachnospiraceae bacterium]
MKKPFSTTKAMITYVVCAVLVVALCIGNYFAYTYKDLITVYTSGSGTVSTEESEELCQRIEEEGMVLLKNDGGLPLSEGAKVSLFGQDSVDFVYGGSGSGEVDTNSVANLREAFEESGFSVNETLWDFYDSGAGKEYRKAVPDETGEGDFEVNEVPVSVYTDDVKKSFADYNDAAIVCIGRSGGESADLPREPLESGAKYLELDQNELDMLTLACKNFDDVVVLLNANNAMELDFLDDPAYANVKGCVWVGGVGQTGIKAIPEALVGNTNFSGHLPDTYAYDSVSAPANVNLGDYDIVNSVRKQDKDGNDVYNKYLVYQEGIYVGYRYYETRYEDVVMGTGNAGDYNYSTTVQFPFGYGLSYTDFEWSDYSVEEKEDSFEVSVKVKNTGDVAGKDVVQIYMQSPYTDYDKANGIEKSAVELVGFAKTNQIEAGSEETVKVTVDKECMKAYDSKGAKTYIVDAGDYYFTAASDAHEATNNILAAKGFTTANGMDADGKADMTSKANVAALDTTTYATSEETGEAITNQLDDVDVTYYDNSFKYLSRNDWTGTYPTTYQNGKWTAPDALLNDLKWDRSDEVTNATSEQPKWDVATDKKVSTAVGSEYDDPVWDELVQAMSADRAMQLVRQGGYATIQVDAIGLPGTQDKDGPSGISSSLVGGQSATSYPVEVVLASTWNVDLIQQMGEMIGVDSVNTGVAGWYAPGVNIHRSPYSGRNFEYFSEDGFLSGQMAGHEIIGTRSAGVLTYAKHFALNDQETNRYGGAIFTNEQAAREIYLKGFEGAVRIGKTNGMMDAMSRAGAKWAGAHKGLVTNILRNEWGFEGVVITDQASVAEMFYQDIISGLSAGTDLWLNTNSGYWDMSKYKEEDGSTKDWTSNATVMNNVQRAAKNVVYAVSTSNAMDGVSEDGTVKESKPLWEIALIILDVVVAILVLIKLIKTLMAHAAYLKTLPKEEEEEGDDIVKKSKVVAIVIIAVIISLVAGIFGSKLIGGGGSGSATIQNVYVFGEVTENQYGGSDYNEYELTLYEDGTYKLTNTQAMYAYSMLMGNTTITCFGEYTMGDSTDGFTKCELAEATRIIYNGYSDAGGFNLSYDTDDESISYPVELPGGEMTEKEAFWEMYGAARTALIDESKTSQMKFAE